MVVIVNNIYDAVYPIILTTAIFGLSSIFVKTQNDTNKLKIFTILKILNILYLTLFSFLLYLAIVDIQNNQFHPNYASGVPKIGVVFQIIAHIIITYTIYLSNITKSENILSCIEDIKKIDGILSDLGENLNYRKHFIYEIAVIVIGFGSFFGRAFIIYVHNFHKVFSKTSDTYYIFFVAPFLSLLMQLQFVFLIILVYERFSLINKLLDNFTVEKRERFCKVKPLPEYNFKHNLKRLELLMELHDRLIDLGNKINDNFDIQILSCLTAQFLSEVFTAFYLYYESLVLKDTTSASVWLIWILCVTMEIFYVTIMCHLTSREAKNTGVVIHKVLMNESDPTIKRRMIIFSQQVYHRPLVFTACGLFQIDATLIFTIAGAAATYLLIMLQFQEGLEAQCSNNTIT